MVFKKMENISSDTEQWMTASKNGNLPYKIFVSQPKDPAPPTGYPVLYVLDGNAFFRMFQEMIRIQSRRSDKTGVFSSIIVGIGYPTEEDFVADRRFYDFTPPAAEVQLPPKPNGGSWPDNGGADLFLQFIEQELKPFIQEHYTIDSNRQTLFGHSLGGLFALHVLFNLPQAFQSYIATSPSIWWNNQAVLQQENDFIANLADQQEDLRLFLSVGSIEKDYMIRDTKALYERLRLLAQHRLHIALLEAEGENHLSVVPTTLSRALRFAFD